MRSRILKSIQDLIESEGRSDVFNKGSSGYDTSVWVLDQLEFVERFPWKTKEERVTVVQMGCKQGVYQDSGAGW